MRKIQKNFWMMVILVAMAELTFANGIGIRNVSVSADISAGRNNVNNFSIVRFDLSWQNTFSSGSANNFDAAWVFIKFRVGTTDRSFSGVNSNGTTVTVRSTNDLRPGMPVVVTGGTGAFAENSTITSITNSTQFVISAAPVTTLNNATIICRRIWEHASLNNTSTLNSGNGHINYGLLNEQNAFNATTNPVVGVMINSNANSSTFLGTWSLRWNHGINNVRDAAAVDIRVFAIEMVYVRGGYSFVVGDGELFSFDVSTISNSDATTTGGRPTGNSVGIPTSSSWPNGYKGFYCMRYELSQGQYRDFLNTLTYSQQATRTSAAPNSPATTNALTTSLRQSIDIQSPGNATLLIPAIYACNLDNDSNYDEIGDGENIAHGPTNWMDNCAYMDWAALRPMTEMEFEKACRGSGVSSIPQQLAWGDSTLYRGTAYTIQNSGRHDENISTGFSVTGPNGYYGGTYNAGFGAPLRVGIFAANSSNNNNQKVSGATIHGIMEMSGNLTELTIGILADSPSLSFTGLHGDGQLSAVGNANTTNWPNIDGSYTDAAGTCKKGGNYGSSKIDLSISYRAYVNEATRSANTIRAVRSITARL